MSYWVESVWVWDFRWRRSLLVWHEDLLLELIGHMDEVVK